MIRNPDEHDAASRVISEAAAAGLIGVSPMTLKRMAERGEGPPRLKISIRRVGYRLRDVEAWVRKAEAAASA
jgi:predicted DNA-binding transcriptional regulator AlpA